MDALIRFNWIFYVIFRNDDQHSSLISFLVALTEVFRRGVWAIFRVENEQIGLNKGLLASKRPKLPFFVEAPAVHEPETEAVGPSPVALALKRVGSAMTSAHAQDYTRKRPEGGSIEEEEDSD
jgi:xenotropic and polytropic retrovirus receptor 1